MGDIIDIEKVDEIYRCNKVKLAVIWISLIFTPISFLFLLSCIIRMFQVKKKLSFFTILILVIFFSEIMNSISKLLQPLKYAFKDERDIKDSTDIGMDNARGIICQIQIVASIFSDYCSLLTTLLLSLRCYDVIKNKKRFFDKGNNGILSIIFVICLSAILAIGFLFFDRILSLKSYRFDVRDRCSYWCWLEHLPSDICFIVYWIILILNIIFTFKTNSYLKKEYKKLIEENQSLSSSSDKMSAPLIDIRKDNNSKNKSKEYNINMNYNNLTKEEKIRIEEIKYMKLKCLVYPFITIIIWLFAAIYRVFDSIIMWPFDHNSSIDGNIEIEKDYFNNHCFIQFLVQFFLVIHTLLSSIRGIIYGFSFIIFEENIFYNFFGRFFKNKNLFENNEESEKRIIRNTNDSSSMNEDSENKSRNEKEEESDKEDFNNNNKSENIEMNTSDYQYKENN